MQHAEKKIHMYTTLTQTNSDFLHLNVAGTLTQYVCQANQMTAQSLRPLDALQLVLEKTFLRDSTKKP